MKSDFAADQGVSLFCKEKILKGGKKVTKFQNRNSHPEPQMVCIFSNI